MENYEQKYKEALEWMRSIYPTMQGAEKEDAEHYFPELRKSEDERIREGLIKGLSAMRDIHKHQTFSDDDINIDDAIAWLEKQGEQKPTDKVEPKFKVGDCIVSETTKMYQVLCIIDGEYRLSSNIDGSVVCAKTKTIDKKYHLWTIQDAKYGDALQANKCTLIFDSLAKDVDGNTVISSWYFCDSKKFYGMGTSQSDLWSIEGVIPATKEQRDLLFQKMKEAGYEWDANTKELKKIEQKSAEKTDVLMSLDEAIRHCNEVAESIAASGCEKCAKEHKQLEKWLTELKELKEQKPTWSEEDSKNLNSVKWIIENSENLNRVFETIDSPKYIKKYFIDWLDYLKDRVQLQPKQEWSKEDEEMYKEVLTDIIYAKNDLKTKGCLGLSKKAMKAFNWFSKRHKSLRPQSKWKPSDDQKQIVSENISLLDTNDLISELEGRGFCITMEE